MRTILIICIIGILFIGTNQFDEDLVRDLPGYPYQSRMYSGFLTLKDSLKRYHYIFHEAQSNPGNKPLVLWLNGGPGCSSMGGWFLEHGPAIYENDGKFKLNPYSWNKAANMIYMESPGGVGFSEINSSSPSELLINDDIAARENFEAIQDFFRKFPSFRDHDFYISGESYGGIYVPMLANEVLEFNKKALSSQKIKLVGFLVGNGVADWNFDTANAAIDFSWAHSFHSYEMRLSYLDHCVNNKDKDSEEEKKKCKAATDKITALHADINIYDAMQDCGPRTPTPQLNANSSYFKYAKWAFPKNGQSKEKNFLSYLFEDQQPLQGEVPCYDTKATEEYLNRADVKKALRVDPNRKWELCNDDVGNRYDIQLKGSIYLYPELVKSGLKILIYSGDTDMAVPFNGNQKWINNLNLRIKSPWRSWRAYNDMTTIAGFRTIYDGLTFVTVKGTGHMVPQWKPKEAYYMFEQFLHDRDL